MKNIKSIILCLISCVYLCSICFISMSCKKPAPAEETIQDRTTQGIVPTSADIETLKNNNQVYDHVVIFGVDGAGDYFKNASTPGFDKVFKNPASITYTALSQYPTSSAPNWGAMIHGVQAKTHGLVNSITDQQKYTDERFPSFFKVFSEANPTKKMLSVVNWPNINYGIIEDLDNLEKIDAGQMYTGNATGIEKSQQIDRIVCDKVIEKISTNPSIIFMQFDSVDAVGHAFGYGKPEFKNAIEYVDTLIGNVYDACIDAGWKDNTLFICVADHGHELTGGHGSDNPTVRNVVFAVAGGKGNIIPGKPGRVVTQDVASIVLYALGIPQPSIYESSVPLNMFTGLKKD